ncbi:MAG: hypothetical protein RLZZ95_998, partial [Pseudomonadota bacterium]
MVRPASKMKPEATSGKRREPTQERAQKTIQTLFKAAAHILDKEG